MSDLTGIFVVMASVLAVVFYCNLRDRRRRLADEIRADIHSAASRVLGGDSMLAIQVEPAVTWHLGRVHLSVPGGYEFLVAAVSGAVIQRLPVDYELVVHRASDRA